MARTIELKWNCRDCDTKGIRGRLKRCPNCGSPREKGEMKMEGLASSDYDASSGKNRAESVTDPELLKLASQRPDWFCTHCSAGNVGTGDRCSTCGAPRYGQKEENHPDAQLGAGEHLKAPSEPEMGECGVEFSDPTGVPVATEPPPLDPEELERAAKKARELAENKRRESAEREAEALAYQEAERVRQERAASFKLWGLVGGGLSLLVLVLGFVYWAFQTHEETGKVSQMTWNQSVHVERWMKETVRGWKHQTSESTPTPPVNGTGDRAGMTLVPGSCSEEHYEDERYVCGSHQVCRDVNRTEQESYSCSRTESYVCGETCTDNGNGFATCSDRTCTRSVPDTCTRSVSVFDHQECHDEPDYCTRPIYKTKCSYETHRWTEIRVVPASGVGLETRWPTVEIEELDRTSRTSAYSVQVSYREGAETYEENPTSETSYKSWTPSAPVTLVINNLGGVHEARH